MGSGYLLDSNAIIGYLAARIPAAGMKAVAEIVDMVPRMSVISQIEVLRFEENEAILADFVGSSVIHPLSGRIARLTIELCRDSRIKLPDAIIAATARADNLTLVTGDVGDFRNIPGLRLFNPWEA